MIANGLTKVLGEAEFKKFLKQVRMVDVSDRLLKKNEERWRQNKFYIPKKFDSALLVV